jgi:hypothetical protein
MFMIYLKSAPVHAVASESSEGSGPGPPRPTGPAPGPLFLVVVGAPARPRLDPPPDPIFFWAQLELIEQHP